MLLLEEAKFTNWKVCKYGNKVEKTNVERCDVRKES